MDNADHIPELARNAVFLADRQPVTTSQTIAEVFGKSHKNVLQAIRDLEAPADFCRLNFQPTSFSVIQPNGGTRKVPGYTITRDGFFMLAMGFTGQQAALFKVAYIEAFNRLEKEVNQPRRPLLWQLYGTPALLNALQQTAPRCITKGLNRAEIIEALEMFGQTPENISHIIIAIREPGCKWHKFPVKAKKGGAR